MTQKEFQSQQFDEIYASGGDGGIYELPYQHSAYLPLFRNVLATLERAGSRSVLEVGCGTGAFAHLVHDKAARLSYRGFDFSPVAVQRAAARFGRPELFHVGDARLPEQYTGDFDAIVCTEVLEHITIDVEVVQQWPPGTRCVCSVPNFDADNHVRFFRTEDEVRSRYGELIQIEHIARVKRPFLSDLSWRNRMRALRWNRYRPDRLLALAGLAPFDDGGWFVFSGPRRG